MEEVGFNEGRVAGESAGSIYSACLDATVPKPLSQSPTTTEGRRRGIGEGLADKAARDTV
jgi:hypothetical protein